MPDRCGAVTSPRGPCAITMTPNRPTRRCSPAGTGRRSRAACFSPRRRSRRDSSRARTPTRTSMARSGSWMRRWMKRFAVSAALVALGCRGGGPARVAPAPAGEPEMRIGLATGAAYVSIGGPEGGELFVSDAASGLPVGSVPAGVRWVVRPDSADPTRLRLIKPDSTRTELLRAIAVVNVTENRFVVANGRRYRGRIQITTARAGLSLVNRVNVESYVAGVVGPEIGGRRADEVNAVFAQAVVTRSFALRNQGRWEAFGFDAYADTRDQV